MNSKRSLDRRLSRVLSKSLEMPRYYKRTLLVLLDFCALSLLLWIALSFRYDVLYVPKSLSSALLLAAGPLLSVAFLGQNGVYRMVTRFIDHRAKSRILLISGIAVLNWALLVFMFGQQGVPRAVILFYALTSGLVVIGVRGLIKVVLENLVGLPAISTPSVPARTTLIYGANRLGIELLQAVRRTHDYKVIGFVDSSPSVWRQYVGGLKVYPPDRLARLIEREDVSDVLIALPSDRYDERREIIRALEPLPARIKILPTYEDLASGKVKVESLRNVEVTDLLGRTPVPSNMNLMRRSTTGKAILVTGAGGSIGSELVKQVTQLNPARVVLLDISERGLYYAEMETRKLLKRQEAATVPEIHAVLGSVTDAALMDQVISDMAIDTIFHAAAYKHVPIVEANPCSGIENNVFGTLVMAQAARRCGVERVVLISTDKAVRPTSVMGASKRVAELILQAMALEDPGQTIFTMVRFGNVLDSSGSVVPLFRQQIKDGGPITVTHREITRYFMSIEEAAELVIQAGAMATGGEVFVLHMGAPVLIDNLARLMIRLSSLKVRDAENPNGDIDIVYTGLRPGEKLYEELLIGEHTLKTEHPHIFKSEEPVLPFERLMKELDALKGAVGTSDKAAVRAIIARTVENYRPPARQQPHNGDAQVEGFTQ